jgi:hypothetical protein
MPRGLRELPRGAGDPSDDVPVRRRARRRRLAMPTLQDELSILI